MMQVPQLLIYAVSIKLVQPRSTTGRRIKRYKDKQLRRLKELEAENKRLKKMYADLNDAPSIKNPGFPQNGKWNVRWENLDKMP